jgi:hypothetical protein
MSERPNNAPPLVMARLWEKTSQKGNTYLTGRLGGVRVLIMPNRDRQTDEDPTHLLMVADAGTPRTSSNGGGR